MSIAHETKKTARAIARAVSARLDVSNAWFAADVAWAAGEAGVLRIGGLSGAKMFLVILAFAFLAGIARDVYTKRDEQSPHAPENRPPMVLSLCPKPREDEHRIVFACPVPSTFPSSDK